MKHLIHFTRAALVVSAAVRLTVTRLEASRGLFKATTPAAVTGSRFDTGAAGATASRSDGGAATATAIALPQATGHPATSALALFRPAVGTSVPAPSGAPARSGMPAPPLVSYSSRSEGGRHCQPDLDAIAAQWLGLSEWRALAPYPVSRYATPTRTIGVWLELWDSAAGTELRRVSADSTVAVRVEGDGCTLRTTTHRRRYNRDSLQAGFTDDSLDGLLSANERGLIYVWSPRMPLSVRGLAEARAAARQMGLAFTAVVADATAPELDALHIAPSDRRTMQSVELEYRNATIHFPTVLFYAHGVLVDGVVPGFRNSATYSALATRWLERQPVNSSGNAFPVLDAAPKFWVDHKARVTTLSITNTPRRIGFFFKPITGTNFVSYTAQDIAYMFNVQTGQEQRIPGHVDPVPTPDGRFITLPGLRFHPVAALIAGDNAPVYTDDELPDEYQTTSILGETRSTVRYRVVTGWRDGARFRDYDVLLDKRGNATRFIPVAAPFAPCTGRVLTLPINAKSGREFGAYDAVANTNFVLEVNDRMQCVNTLDLGFASGKLSFSYDGAAIAFATSRINVDMEGDLIRPSESFFKDALVLFRKTGRIVSLSRNEPISGLTFPEFLKGGAVMLLDQGSRLRPLEVLRVVSVR